MVNRNSPTSFFWNCLGAALFVSSIGVAISVARTETLSLELARYKLQTGSAIERVQKVSESLEETTKTLPIPQRQKQEIQQQLDKSKEVIDRAEATLERNVSKQLNESESMP